MKRIIARGGPWDGEEHVVGQEKIVYRWPEDIPPCRCLMCDPKNPVYIATGDVDEQGRWVYVPEAHF